MGISPQIKNFIIEHKDLINESDFKTLFEIWGKSYFSEFNLRELIAVFDHAGINCLYYIDNIPALAYVDRDDLRDIIIPNSIKNIGYSAFARCSNLTSVILGDGITSIGDWAFSNCSSLTSIKIPDSVTSIGNFAFQYCASLTSVTIGDGVTSIGEDAFWRCNKLSIVCNPGSYAHNYCKVWNIPFELTY